MTIRKALCRHPLSFALTSALLATGIAPAFAQEAGNEAGGKNATNLDRVSVVGSRIKRSDVEGPAPVTVITRTDIDREGFQTVGDMLQTLTQNTTSSFTGDLAVTGFTPNAQVVNLRNLGPGYTLTLVNGRRPAQYPQPYNRDNNVANINSIPSSIVERVEVLTGGASAIYGSDAVAGVVNIVLREHYDGNLLRVTGGTTAEGGGDTVNVELTGGRTGDRWSAVWALQYSDREPVFASQRKWLSDLREGPLGSTANPNLSLIAIRGVTSANGLVNQNALYPGEEKCDALGFTTVTTAARGKYCGSYTSNAARSISNKRKFYSAYGYGTFDFTDTTQGFASVNYYTTKAKASAGTEFWSTSGDRFNQTRAGAATQYFWDPNLRDLVSLQRVFTPEELGGNEAASTLYDEYTYDFNVGVRGNFADRFDWEASAGYGYYDYKMDRPRLLAQAVHDYFLGPRLGYANTTGGTTGNAIYPVYALNQDRWTSPITPDIYRSFSTRVINRSETSVANANFNVSGDLFDVPAGAVGFAGVLEWNRQKMDMISDPRTDQLRPIDNQTIYNLTSSGETHGTRDRYAVGAEFRVPIFSSLSANAAARYDKYDDISSVDAATTYNFGLEWRPFSNLLVRGSYATSFRAPDMQLIYAQGAASYTTELDEYACRSGTGAGAAQGPRTRAVCNATANDPTKYSVQTLVAGNPNLTEEKGKSWGAGFVWDVTDGMSLTVDYYRIRLEDAAAQLSNDYLLRADAACRLGSTSDPSRPMPSASLCSQLSTLINRVDQPGAPDNGRISRINNAYINTALQDTSGIDASYKYNLDTDRWGRFNFDLGYSLTLTNKYKQLKEEPLIDYRDLPPEYWNPERSRARGSVTWSKGDWATTVFGTRYGSAFSSLDTAGTNSAGGYYPRRLPPFFLWNLSVGKKFGENVLATFQVVNVFDNQYRQDNSRTAYPFYDPFIGADPLGRRFYMSLQYKF
ncbi:TonB-dependent receptor domain-containing protein [Stenotrophomonas sp. C1657]|uniref:TonB-dependent receptor domain-containing protein n=1 Tax=Stenotrophomonas sp. C1657 TaxID=3077844 RepID=UPI00293C1C09|nr:TonB-dependent receptor [Stenotrophomonas sp. C1657]MDV3515005.1 TonB-dependent receptor [Stenotrophomonas sp. C1657]